MVSNSKLAFQEERRPATLKLSFADNGFPVFNTHQGHTLLLHFIPVIQQFSLFRIRHNLLAGLYISPNKAINKYMHWLVCVTTPPAPTENTTTLIQQVWQYYTHATGWMQTQKCEWSDYNFETSWFHMNISALNDNNKKNCFETNTFTAILQDQFKTTLLKSSEACMELASKVTTILVI